MRKLLLDSRPVHDDIFGELAKRIRDFEYLVRNYQGDLSRFDQEFEVPVDQDFGDFVRENFQVVFNRLNALKDAENTLS